MILGIVVYSREEGLKRYLKGLKRYLKGLKRYLKGLKRYLKGLICKDLLRGGVCR
jgi:hypothetical protein